VKRIAITILVLAAALGIPLAVAAEVSMGEAVVAEVLYGELSESIENRADSSPVVATVIFHRPLQSRWTTPDKVMVMTDWEVTVQGFHKGGLASPKIVVSVPGGELEGMSFRAINGVEPAAGEKAVVFLERIAADPDNTFRIYGLDKGKFTVRPDGSVGNKAEKLKLPELLDIVGKSK
jgi:hypothetical protein